MGKAGAGPGAVRGSPRALRALETAGRMQWMHIPGGLGTCLHQTGQRSVIRCCEWGQFR